MELKMIRRLNQQSKGIFRQKEELKECWQNHKIKTQSTVAGIIHSPLPTTSLISRTQCIRKCIKANEYIYSNIECTILFDQRPLLFLVPLPSPHFCSYLNVQQRLGARMIPK